MSKIRRIIIRLYKTYKNNPRNEESINKENSIVVLRNLGAHDFFKSSRKKFTEIKSESQSLYK